MHVYAESFQSFILNILPIFLAMLFPYFLEKSLKIILSNILILCLCI